MNWHQGSNPRTSAHQMQRTRLWRMSLNLLAGEEISYITRGEDNRTVGREWLYKIYRYYLDSLGYWLIMLVI